MSNLEKNRFVCLSIDVEPDLRTNKYSSIKAIPSFLKILKKNNAKATFFATCDCIEKFPALFKKIKKQGHEIALHGYRHERMDSFSYADKLNQLDLSKKCFKKNQGCYSQGFRAVQHSIDADGIKSLEKSGFMYDPSLMPWNFHHIFFPQIKIRFFNNFRSLKIKNLGKIKEAPITSLVLPFSAFTIRLLPFWMFKIYLRLIRIFKIKIFMMHSWDLIEIPDSRLYRACPIKEFEHRLGYMLEYFRTKGEKFQTIGSLPPIQA